jgi:S-adenosylmethionine:tRNA ribosyltransferase-isomerase
LRELSTINYSLRTSDFDYDLPAEFIAQTPMEPRDAARLLVLDRETGAMRHSVFSQIGQFLRASDLLVLNETRVIPARLCARKIPTGGRIELLLLQPTSELIWEVLVGGKGIKIGSRLEIEQGPSAEIIGSLGGPLRLVHFAEPIEPLLNQIGRVPLPPYIHNPLIDPERYQTVYASKLGSSAAPTAGLHFTPQLIDLLREMGVRFTFLTLHVGLDTFAPVTEVDPLDHQIHSEWCQISQQAVEEINRARREGGRIIAVGTTSIRTLESAVCKASISEGLSAFEGPTNLFILPGYNFRVVNAMITNFHLPRSTLIMLVSAFAGRENILAAYNEAKQQGYRFYSFGDAMFIQ